MTQPNRKSWVACAILTGVAYYVVGIVFARLDETPDKHALFLWRLAAYIVSALVFALHIAYEHFGLRNRTIRVASHVTAAVAIGAFLLAATAIIHALTAVSHAPYWQYLLALVLWPIFTAVPAFLVSIVIAAVLDRFPGRRFAE